MDTAPCAGTSGTPRPSGSGSRATRPGSSTLGQRWHPRCLTRLQDTIHTDKCIIRLVANGHTNASIAELMGTTEGMIRNRRQRIRRLLEHMLPLDAFVEYDRTGGNHQRACEIQSTYPDRRKPVPAS